jgi:hypothetical protein
MSAAELVELVDSRLALFVEHGPSDQSDGLLDRAGAARFLVVSLSKLDVLCRREDDPLPYAMVADARRFDRADLAAWVKRQRRRGLA